MATAGPNTADTVADDAGTGTVTWTNPTNAATENSTRAVASLVSSTSHYLKWTDFDFAIPAGSTIDGITVTFNWNDGAGSATVARVRLVKGDVIQSTDKAGGEALPAADGDQSYGGAADLWSDTWTVDDINSTGFGMVVSLTGTATAQVDVGTITITYTEAAGGQPTRTMQQQRLRRAA